MKKHEKILKHILGEDGLEVLSKIIERKRTSNVADPLELYLPLLVVPRAILSWLVQNIRPIEINETKTLDFPNKKDIKIEIRKLDTDVYQGEFIQNGKVIHKFNRQTLPSLGGHLMTVGELYDDIVDDEKIGNTVQTITDLTSDKDEEKEKTEEKQEHKMIDQNANQLTAMTEIVGKLIDALISNKIEKDNIEPKKEKKAEKDDKEEDTEKGEMKGKTLKEPLKEHIIDPVKKPQDTFRDSQKEKQQDKTTISKEEMIKAGGFNKPSGSAMPMKPKMPVPPIPPGSAPNAAGLAQKQTNIAARGKQNTPSLSGANKPIGNIDRKQTSSNKTGATTQISNQNVAIKDDPLDRTPNKSHLLRKLNKRTRKSETGLKHGITAEEMLSKCVHCDVPEFTKSEKGDYKFTPCNCFTVMQKTENGRKSWFVKISKSEQGFKLNFNPKADKESIKAFLITVKNTMKKRD